MLFFRQNSQNQCTLITAKVADRVLRSALTHDIEIFMEHLSEPCIFGKTTID